MGLTKIDLTRGLDLYESKHQDGERIDSHHHQIYQILFAIEGEGMLMMDRSHYSFSADHAAFIVPYCEHAIRSESSLTLLVLAFDETVLDRFAIQDLLHNNLQHSVFMELHPFASGELRQLLRKMLYEQSNEEAYQQWALHIYLLEVLLVLARNRRAPAVTDSNSLRADRIQKYIDSHYFESIKLSDLASRLSVSSRHVNNIFKEVYHTTPIQYLTEVRISRAKKLLTETDKDIASICFEVGYESLPTFYRAFKNAVHLSPNQYRRTNQIY